jgi:hypothetical protein
LKNIFPNAKLYTCYYHYAKSIRKNLLYYINLNKDGRELLYNILANFRILPFTNIDKFINVIKNEYKNNIEWKNQKIFWKYIKTQWYKKVNLNNGIYMN